MTYSLRLRRGLAPSRLVGKLFRWLGGFEVAVQHVGIEVGPVRPSDGPEPSINCDLGEEFVIPGDIRKYRTPQERCQVHDTD